MDVKNNDNNIYRLYKLVFENKYLSTIIFNFAKIFNKQITESNRNLKSFTQCANYKQSTLEWIFNNGHYPLFIDKIKANYQFKFTFTTLKTVLEFFKDKTNDEFSGEYGQLFNQFYKVNEIEMKNSDLSDNETHFKKISLLELSVHIQSYYLLKMFTQEELINKPHLTISTLKNELINEQPFDSGYSCRSLLDLALKLGNIDIIKFLHTQLEITLKEPKKALHSALISDNRSNVVKFLLDDLNYSPPLEYSGAFDNFFYNLMNLDFQVFKRVYDMGSPLISVGNEISKLTSIFNQSFKRELSNDTNKYYYDNFYNYYEYFIVDTNDKAIPFGRFVEFIQCSIFVSAVDRNSSPEKIKRNSLLLKKIRYLIKYNNDIDKKKKKTNHQIYNLKEKDLIIPNQHSIKKNSELTPSQNDNNKDENNIDTDKNDDSNSNIGLIKKFKSMVFGIINKQSNRIKEDQEEIIERKTETHFNYQEFGEFSDIGYENFNLQREVERVYIFDYLANETLLVMSENFKIMVLNFARKYKQYHLIDKCKDTDIHRSHLKFGLLMSDFYGDHELLDYLKKSFNPSVLIAKPISELKNSIYCGEDKITYTYGLEMHHELINPTKQYPKKQYYFNSDVYEPTSFLFDLDEIEIDQQIQFIKSRLNLNLIISFSNDLLLKHVFKQTNSKFKIPFHADQIALILKDHYSKLNASDQKKACSILFCANILTSNPKLFIYYYENHKQLFNWDSPFIGRLIVSKGDLELIKFIYKNNIGDLNFNIGPNNNDNDPNKETTILDCCKTKEVAKLLLDFGFKFSNNSLAHHYFHDDWSSNYLFYFTFYRLVEYDEDIKLTPVMSSHYAHFKFIESKIIGISSDNGKDDNGRILNFSKIKLPPKSFGMFTLKDMERMSSKRPYEEEVSRYFKSVYCFYSAFSTGGYNNVLSFFNDYSNSNESHKKHYSFDTRNVSNTISEIPSNFPIFRLIEKKIKQNVLILNK